MDVATNRDTKSHNRDDITALKQTDSETSIDDSKTLKKASLDEEIDESVSKLESVITKTIENTKHIEDIPDIEVDQPVDDLLKQVLREPSQTLPEPTFSEKSDHMNLKSIYDNPQSEDNDFNVAEVLGSQTSTMAGIKMEDSADNVASHIETATTSLPSHVHHNPPLTTTTSNNHDNHIEDNSLTSSNHRHHHQNIDHHHRDTGSSPIDLTSTTTITTSLLTPPPPVILIDSTDLTITPPAQPIDISSINSSSSSSSSSSTLISSSTPTIITTTTTTTTPTNTNLSAKSNKVMCVLFCTVPKMSKLPDQQKKKKLSESKFRIFAVFIPFFASNP